MPLPARVISLPTNSNIFLTPKQISTEKNIKRFAALKRKYRSGVSILCLRRLEASGWLSDEICGVQRGT